MSRLLTVTLCVTHGAEFSIAGLLRCRRSNSVYGPRSALSLHLSRLMPLVLAAQHDVLTRQQVQLLTAIRFVPNAVKPPHKVVEVANILGTSWFQKCQALFVRQKNIVDAGHVPFFEIQKGHIVNLDDPHSQGD